ncbi:MAG: ATP-binding protein [Syntrophobacteraceae bacterium]|jgi:anti-sigma regulatory factor (Ser/Thr protein kinase)|nr:ATP-binding protein [Syntrophobacteraceae bacterium]
MPAKPEYLEMLQDCVLETVRGTGASTQELFRIEFALEEILTNINKYAYPDREGEIEIACGMDDSRMLRIVIRDWGEPFNPTLCPTPDICQDACSRPLGGLGVYLTRRMAGDLIYERLPDGNQLTILFQL